MNKSKDNLSQTDKDWIEMIELLSTKDLVLKPYELFEYMALLIKTFAGTNICIAINSECKNDKKYENKNN